MTSNIEQFNEILNEFLEKIVNQFPESTKLKNYRKAFLLLRLATPKIPSNLFMASVINYKSEIRNRDEKFFLTNKIVQDKVKMVSSFSEDTGLSYYWNTLSLKTKTSIWEYVQTLFVLGEVIISKDSVLFDKYTKLYLSDYQKEINNLHGNNFSLEFIQKINS